MDPKVLIEAYVDDVVRRISRRRRNDVGVELRLLLTEELSHEADTAGRPADGEMAMGLLRRFGRPDDVAMRYRNPGFALIDHAEAPTFVVLSVVGVALIWGVSLTALLGQPGGAGRLGAWWMSTGLGAFAWPGFLIACMSAAAWVRRRFPATDEWTPRLIDADRVNRSVWVGAIVAYVLGTMWLSAPAVIIEQLSGGRLSPEFSANFAYTDTFRQVQLPLLLALMAANIMLCVVVVAEGRWRVLTRRIEIASSALFNGVLLWSALAGPLLVHGPADRVARACIVLIAMVGVFDVGAKLLREQARVRTPRALRQ